MVIINEVRLAELSIVIAIELLEDLLLLEELVFICVLVRDQR